MNLRELKLNKMAFDKMIPHRVLKASYKSICANLDSTTFLSKTTYAQKQFSEILTTRTRLKIYENVWIGKRNIDFLIPCIKVREECWERKGIAYEIDGGIHNAEFKIRMDSGIFLDC